MGALTCRAGGDLRRAHRRHVQPAADRRHGTKLTVENPINRYSLGSDNDLKKNKDGSITIYLQKDSPGKDKESNWLPTPAGPLYTVMRNYAPTDAAFEALKDPAKTKLLPKVIPVP
jgi:hypothetical protein